LCNKVILAAVKQALNVDTEYSLCVNYDTEGNPILRVSPVANFTEDNRKTSGQLKSLAEKRSREFLKKGNMFSQRRGVE
jgi:hypothetical protein